MKEPNKNSKTWAKKKQNLFCTLLKLPEHVILPGPKFLMLLVIGGSSCWVLWSLEVTTRQHTRLYLRLWNFSQTARTCSDHWSIHGTCHCLRSEFHKSNGQFRCQDRNTKVHQSAPIHVISAVKSLKVRSAETMLASPVAPTLTVPFRTKPWNGSQPCQRCPPRDHRDPRAFATKTPLVAPVVLCAGSLRSLRQSYSARRRTVRATSHGVDPIADPAHHRVWEGWEDWRIG